MFKVGDIIVVQDQNLGIIVSVDEYYVSIYWNFNDKTLLYDYSHLEKLVTESNSIWSHHAN